MPYRKKLIEAPGIIKLIVADVDGCLSRGSNSFFSMGILRRLMEVNEASRTDPAVPAITFCTGRPQPYVECLIQATHGYMPALCESGTVFFDPQTHEIAMHPKYTSREQKMLETLRGMVAERLLSEKVKPEPGKVTQITLIIAPPLTPEDLLPPAQEIADEFGGEIIVETTRICIHFLFRKLTKGIGVEWLSEHTGISPLEMAGIGDSHPDLPFLRMMGLSCAPSNAQDAVRDFCSCVSDKADAEAAIDFVDYVIERNRARLARVYAPTGGN